jgi:hypothetical protein
VLLSLTGTRKDCASRDSLLGAADKCLDQLEHALARAGRLKVIQKVGRGWQALLDKLYRNKSANGLGGLPVLNKKARCSITSDRADCTITTRYRAALGTVPSSSKDTTSKLSAPEAPVV